MFLKTLKANFLKFNPICFQSVKFLNYKPIETDNKIVNGHKLTQVIEKNRQKTFNKKNINFLAKFLLINRSIQ